MGAGKKGGESNRVNDGKGPFASIKSLFFPKKTGDDGDISLDIPEVLKKTP